MKHLVGRAEHPAVLPIDAHKILGAFVPEQREAVPGHREYVEVGAVAVRLLVGADGQLGGWGVDGAAGEDEHHVRSAGTALVPSLKLESREIGNEIGLPHIAARPYRDELDFSAELFGRSLALGKGVAVVEYEGFVVKQVEHEREIVGGGKARALTPARIEVLIAGVERQGEQALGSPFEAVLAAVAGLDRGVAVTGQHVDDLFEQMLLRRRLRARREIEHEDRDKIAAALEVDEAAIHAEARPRRGRDREQVDAEILGDRYA